MDKPNIDKTMRKESWVKFLKYLCLTALVTSLLVMLIAYFVAPSVRYFFSNEGKLICVERRGWAFLEGTTTCYKISKI